ncbi:MAG: type IV pilus modification PilV family protein [Candidatus Binatia bacterium]
MKSIERRRGALHDQRGVTLLETVVALGLFAMSAATIGTFMVSQIRHASSNDLYTKAYALAEEELEATRALRFDDMADGTRTVQLGGMSYTVVKQVDDDTPASGLKQIQVDVNWSDSGGPRNVSVHTIYTEVRRF